MKTEKINGLTPVIKEKTEIVISGNSPIEMMQSMINSGIDLDKIEKFIDIQDKYDKLQAKKAFTVAMSEFKSDPPIITKDKTNKKFGSRYTTIGGLVNPSLPKMSKVGLSHKWKTLPQRDDCFIGVECIVTHSAGHSESCEMWAPPDTEGSKNPIQQIKSTKTYLKICTFEDIMGLASSEANLNDDGNAASESYIDEKQKSNIRDMLVSIDSKESDFMKYLGVVSIDLIPESKYKFAMMALRAKEAKKAKEEAQNMGESNGNS